MRWSTSFLSLYLFPKSSTTSVKIMSLSLYVQSHWMIFPVHIHKVAVNTWVLHALSFHLSPGHTLPFWFLHIGIHSISCCLVHICQWSLVEWFWALSKSIRPSTLDFLGKRYWHLQLVISHLVLKGCCSNEVCPLINMMWGWIMVHRIKVCYLSLWVKMCGFLSSGVWCCILCSCMWPCCLGETRSCVWINMCLFPRYLIFLGMGVLSNLSFPLYILVCLDRSWCACTLGVFQSLGRWTRLFDTYVLSRLLLSCWCGPSLFLLYVLCMGVLVWGVVF